MTKCQYFLGYTETDQPYYFQGNCTNEPKEGFDYCEKHIKTCSCGAPITGVCTQDGGTLICGAKYCEKCGCKTHGVEI